jgi:hypothetical protein
LFSYYSYPDSDYAKNKNYFYVTYNLIAVPCFSPTDTGVSSSINYDSFLARNAETSATNDNQGMVMLAISTTVDTTRGMSVRTATTDYQGEPKHISALLCIVL